jgi:hypothetical protein
MAFLAAFVAFSIGSAQEPDALPSGVSVRLDTDGKTNYLMGEPIVLRLTLSGDNTDYAVDTMTVFGVSETINITPADQTFRWHGRVSGDVFTIAPLSETGLTMSILLNDAIVIKTPGTYSVSVSTKRIFQANPTRSTAVTSFDPVEMNRR